MRIARVTVNKGRTVNLGNYESAKFEYGLEAIVEKCEEQEDVKKILSDMLDEWVEEELGVIAKS